MKYRLFISDYDGTLGSSATNDIDSETLAAINAFTDKGGIFVVCSGRETSSISTILREQNLKGLVVSFQGARISDIESGKRLFDGGLDVKFALNIIREMRPWGFEPVMFVEDDVYFEQMSEHAKGYLNAIRLKGKIAKAEDLLGNLSGKVCKICWLGDDAEINRAAVEMNQKYKGKGVYFNSGAKFLLEAINPDCSKGVAVKYLAEKYGVPLKEVLAVGDSTNDIELVRGEWHGVAVGDGREELKAVAKEITVPFKEKPVKYLLEKYCLND